MLTATIYWDNQDPKHTGWAYRLTDTYRVAPDGPEVSEVVDSGAYPGMPDDATDDELKADWARYCETVDAIEVLR